MKKQSGEKRTDAMAPNMYVSHVEIFMALVSEPTSGLDVQSARMIRQKLLEIRDEGDKFWI